MASSFHNTSRLKHVKAISDYKPLQKKESIRFSVIGLNHGHIYGQVAALLQGGGELVAVYAKEPDFLNGFTR